MVATYAHLYGRSIDLNFVAGGFRNDLLSLDDDTPHNERYERLIEYASIVKALLVEEAHRSRSRVATTPFATCG